MKKAFFIILAPVFLSILFMPYSSSGDDSDLEFKSPQNRQRTELLWGGVNNVDIFDEPDYVLDEMLDQLAKANLRVIRIWIDFRLEMDEDGHAMPYGQYNDCILNAIDNLMVKAKKKGILLLITLQAYNWISGSISVSKDFYEWRECKTPYNVYLKSLTDGPQTVKGPYYQRWGKYAKTYITNPLMKNQYKLRVHHILNHVNPHFKKKWKDINDVIWAWGLQNEPDKHLDGTADELKDWFNEMAAYVKSIDPDTYVALGTLVWPDYNIQDADIYTQHYYGDITDQEIQDYQKNIAIPFGKLLLVEEFNATGRHTPDYLISRQRFEESMEVLRRNGVPWMIWEHGYWFDSDDIWHTNKSPFLCGYCDTGKSDGVFWGGKVLPGAKKIWQSSWNPDSTGKKWKVHKMVDDICVAPNPACKTGGIFFIDTFSDVGPPGSEYEIFDEDAKDIYFLSPNNSTSDWPEYGYLIIGAHKWQDLWGGTPVKTGAPLVLHAVPPGEYFSVETFVSADPLLRTPGGKKIEPSQALNTQMGLFVFQDVDNWIFFGLTNHDFTIGDTSYQGDGLIITLTHNGVSSIVTTKPLTEDYAFLKIDHRADLWRFSWKRENGEEWNNMWSIFMTLKDYKVGMGLKTLDVFPQPSELGYAHFDYFLIGNP